MSERDEIRYQTLLEHNGVPNIHCVYRSAGRDKWEWLSVIVERNTGKKAYVRGGYRDVYATSSLLDGKRHARSSTNKMPQFVTDRLHIVAFDSAFMEGETVYVAFNLSDLELVAVLLLRNGDNIHHVETVDEFRRLGFASELICAIRKRVGRPLRAYGVTGNGKALVDKLKAAEEDCVGDL